MVVRGRGKGHAARRRPPFVAASLFVALTEAVVIALSLLPSVVTTPVSGISTTHAVRVQSVSPIARPATIPAKVPRAAIAAIEASPSR